MLQLPFLFLLQPRLLQLVVDGPHYGAARDAHAQERGEPDAEVAERALPAPKPARKKLQIAHARGSEPRAAEGAGADGFRWGRACEGEWPRRQIIITRASNA